MLYNAIGSGGQTLSGHLRETELKRLQLEAEAQAQVERDALLAEYQKLEDLDRQQAEYGQKAQELGISPPAAGSIDDQIFRATGGFARSPALRLSMAPQGGTQLPTSTPRTEWAPSQAESMISADALRASKDLLSGRKSIDTDRYRKNMEALRGLAIRASSRPSTSAMAKTFDEQSKTSSEFMTREGSIADAGRSLQGTLAGRFIEGRQRSADSRQQTEFEQKNANWRASQQNASAERMNKDRLEEKEKDRERLEAKELRLQQQALINAGKFAEAQKAKLLADVKAVRAGDLTMADFLQAHPKTATDTGFFGGVDIRKLDLTEMQNQVDRAVFLLPQYQDELARRAEYATPSPANPAIVPLRSSGLGGKMLPDTTMPSGNLPYLGVKERKAL